MLIAVDQIWGKNVGREWGGGVRSGVLIVKKEACFSRKKKELVLRSMKQPRCFGIRGSEWGSKEFRNANFSKEPKWSVLWGLL